MTQLDLFPEHREHLTQPAGLEGNARKIIVSLFDYSGEWSRPYREAGYTVIQFDKQLDGIDLATTPPQEIADIIRDRLNRPAYEVWGMLIAHPCDRFAGCAARHFAEWDANGKTNLALKMFDNTMEIVKYFQFDKRTNTIAEFDADAARRLYPDAGLKFWVFENPPGRLPTLRPGFKKFGPKLFTNKKGNRVKCFEPHWHGDPYTKKTQLFGEGFTPPPITNYVQPVEGSKIWKMGPTPDPQTRKNARSKTPKGFARAFFAYNP